MRLSATAMQLKSQRKAPLTPARPCALTSPRPAPYHSRSIAPDMEHHSGMAEPTDTQEPVDPLTVGTHHTLVADVSALHAPRRRPFYCG